MTLNELIKVIETKPGGHVQLPSRVLLSLLTQLELSPKRQPTGSSLEAERQRAAISWPEGLEAKRVMLDLRAKTSARMGMQWIAEDHYAIGFNDCLDWLRKNA